MIDETLGAQGLPIYPCPKIDVPPTIDGRVDEDVWQSAPVVNLSITETGDAPERSTKARMCWDDNNLYISFECTDPQIWATLTKHDDPIYNEDVVEAFLDPDGDLKTYIELEVSPKNVTFDASFDAENGRPLGSDEARNWTCEGMRTAVTVNETDQRWSVEIAVPFASLDRPTPSPGEMWRGNLYRIDYRPEPAEFQAWSPTMARNYHRTERFGVIVFTVDG